MMTSRNTLTQCKIATALTIALLSLSSPTQASFIESTIGTAVVNDATASYYNPAALSLIKNAQIIPQGTIAHFHTDYSGQSTTVSNGTTESGSTSSTTRYYSPSLYLGLPVTNRITLGLAIVSNAADRNTDQSSVLRYVQSSNNIQDYDIVPAIAIKINNVFSVGGGINFSYADFHLHPITGFPGSNIADSESNNKSDGTGVGANVGILLTPSATTTVGFNYRSMTTYRLSGTSEYEGNPQVNSDQYHFKLWTPARSVASINHFFTPKIGLIATAQRIQWSCISNVHVYGIAGVSGTTPVIRNGSIPYYLRDTWVLTLGSHYQVTPKWVVRFAGSYNQSPGNPHYQIANGDSIVLGMSMGYKINQTVAIDGSYAHAFMKDENININGNRFVIRGINEGSRDAVSLKLTYNL